MVGLFAVGLQLLGFGGAVWCGFVFSGCGGGFALFVCVWFCVLVTLTRGCGLVIYPFWSFGALGLVMLCFWGVCAVGLGGLVLWYATCWCCCVCVLGWRIGDCWRYCLICVLPWW